jgi:hypothetical protein
LEGGVAGPGITSGIDKSENWGTSGRGIGMGRRGVYGFDTRGGVTGGEFAASAGCSIGGRGRGFVASGSRLRYETYGVGIDIGGECTIEDGTFGRSDAGKLSSEDFL